MSDGWTIGLDDLVFKAVNIWLNNFLLCKCLSYIESTARGKQFRRKLNYGWPLGDLNKKETLSGYIPPSHNEEVLV